MNEELWEQYIEEQKIQFEYFDKHEHRGYDVRSGIHRSMNAKELDDNYYYWCEKKLIERM